MEVISRIKEIIRLKAKSVLDFSKTIGVNQVTLNNQIIGNRKLSLETIISITNTYPDISAEWLLRGEGDMIKKESSPEVEELLKYIKQLEALNMSGEALLQDKYEVIERLEKEIRNLKANISLLEDKLNMKEAG